MLFSSVSHELDHLRAQFHILAEIVCDWPDPDLACLELYSALRDVTLDRYQSNQRFVFVLERDFYQEGVPAGAVLQTIQMVVQDLDISNFFVCIVTTNPDASSEMNFVNSTINWDPVSIGVYQCQGSWMLTPKRYRPVLGKLQSIKHIVDDARTLSQQQKQRFFADDAFCIMPWVGINVSTDSSVTPCCEYQGPSLGDVSQQSLKQIWNDAPIRKLRLEMLQGKQVKNCERCYHKESLGRDSLRQSINRDFVRHAKRIDHTSADGFLKDDSVLYWDTRYNNLCNFACRMCRPKDSSSWFQVHNAINPNQPLATPLLTAGQDKDAIFDQICLDIDKVEKIYFAGGEPMMIDNFYKILEMLDSLGRHHVHLCYNINLSRLELNNKSILSLWKKFPRVSVGASLDAMGPRAEYIRTGTIWSNIEHNRRLIKEHCSHVDFYVTATTGIINALHVPDFHQAWVEKGLINVEDFNIQLLYRPAYLSVANAPDKLKAKIIDRYQEHINWITGRDSLGRAASGFSSIVSLCGEPGSYDRNQFWCETTKLDRYHDTDLFTVFPELQNLDL